MARGALILGLFGVGAALPLVAIAYGSRGGFDRMQDRVARHLPALKKGFGLLLLLVGLSVLSGADRWLEARVVDSLPDWWINLTVRY